MSVCMSEELFFHSLILTLSFSSFLFHNLQNQINTQMKSDLTEMCAIRCRRHRKTREREPEKNESEKKFAPFVQVKLCWVCADDIHTKENSQIPGKTLALFTTYRFTHSMLSNIAKELLSAHISSILCKIFTNTSLTKARSFAGVSDCVRTCQY